MFKHLLVPTDGSPLSQATVTQAVAFAHSCGARITFFHAAPNVPAIQGGAGALSDPTIAKAFHEKVDAAANQALSAAAAQSAQAHVACDTVLVHGNQPAEAIVQAASQQGCDLIFMASHGRRGVSALLLGSETNKVLTHCKIPVLVYR